MTWSHDPKLFLVRDGKFVWVRKRDRARWLAARVLHRLAHWVDV